MRCCGTGICTQPLVTDLASIKTCTKSEEESTQSYIRAVILFPRVFANAFLGITCKQADCSWCTAAQTDYTTAAGQLQAHTKSIELLT
jgi:hypothetical protein